MEATFEQHRSFLHSPVKPIDKDTGFQQFRRSLTMPDEETTPLDKLVGFDLFRRSLTMPRTETQPSTKVSGFKAYRRSLNIASPGASPSQPDFKLGRSSSNLKDDSHMSKSNLLEQASEGPLKEPNVYAPSTTFPRCLPRDLSQASTTASVFADDDEDDFSQANTTAGEYADEGPMDSRRCVLLN